MDEEENAKQQEQELPDKIAKQGEDFVKDQARNMGKEAAKKAGKIATRAVVAILHALLPIIIVIIVISLLAGVMYVITDKISQVANNVSSVLKIGDNGPLAPSKEEVIASLDEELSAIGISKDDLRLGNKYQTNEYLYKFKMASLATQIPYVKDGFGKTMANILIDARDALTGAASGAIGGSLIESDPVADGILTGITGQKEKEVKGIVKIKRRSIDGKEKDIEYIGYEKFTELVKNNDKSALNHFSINDDWMLCVAKPTTVVTNTNGTSSTTITIDEVQIPYKTMISNYAVPFSFLINLQQFTYCPEYVSAVADMIMEDGEIDLTIFESEEVITTTETDTYTLNTKIEHQEDDTLDDLDTSMIEDTGTSGGALDGLDTSMLETETPSDGYDRTSVAHTDVTTTTTTITTITADVTKADVWVISKDTNYEKQKEDPVEGMNVTNTYEESEPEGEGSWKTGGSTTTTETTQKSTWQQKDSKMEITPDEFLGLWKNTTGIALRGAKYNPNGIQVKYGIPLTPDRKSPLENLFSADEMFCDVLERNEETQLHSQIMKELIKYYKANGDYEINIDFSQFNTTEFSPITSIYGNNCEEKIWFALRDAGYDEYAVAGAMGNLMRESGFKSNNVENCVNTQAGLSDEEFTEQVNNGTISKDKFATCYEWGEKDKYGKPTGLYGYGIAQWTWPSYKEELYDLAKSKGVGIDDEELQIEFLLKHMQRAGYSKTQTSPSDAAYKFHSQVERSADGPSAIKDRADYAEDFYRKYQGKEAPDMMEIDTPLAGENAEKMKKMINEAIRIANDNRYTYSQPRRYETYYYDCSSFCARLYKQFFNINIPGSTSVYGKYGYIGPVNSVQLQPGDILWKSGHVEMWIGNNQRVGAHMHYPSHPQDDISVTTGKGSFTSVYRFIK